MLIISDRAFARIVSFVAERYGINLAKKRALIQGRLALDIERRGYASFEAYIDAVAARPDGPECQHMIDKLSTNHTFFFREPACFTHMRDVAVPALLRRGVKRIDIWCAAASAGQECYTAAMLLEDALAASDGADYRILGSDINSEVLEQARLGVYSNKELENIPDRFQRRYCRPLDGERFAISPLLRERVSWRQINLGKLPLTFAPSAFHLIFCRNVMIYFAAETKEALTTELHRLVCDDGYVYVGSTETLDMKRTRFQYLSPSIFAKRRTDV